MLTRITDVDILESLGTNSVNCLDCGMSLTKFGVAIQAQLESCEKEHQERVREIFEEIEEKFFVFDADGNLVVKSVFSQRVVDWWKGLKERWMK